MPRKEMIIMTLGLLLTSFISLSFYVHQINQKDRVDIHTFPLQIDQWRAKDIPLSKKETAILGTENAFVRKYTNDIGQTVYLYIVYSQNNRKVFHPPEICYTGEGFTVLEKRLEHFSVNSKSMIPVNRLLLNKGGKFEIAYYWFKAGPEFTSNYLKNQLVTSFNNFFKSNGGNAMIRVSMSLPTVPSSGIPPEIQDFVNKAEPLFLQYLP